MAESKEADLTPSIKVAGTYCLNEKGAGAHKTLFEANDTALTSDCDEQLIIFIPFQDMVKVREIEVTCPAGDKAPTEMKVFANVKTLGFEDVEELLPTQEIDVSSTVSGKPQVFKLEFVKFQCVTGLHLFFDCKRDENEDMQTSIQRVRLFGESFSKSTIDDLKPCSS